MNLKINISCCQTLSEDFIREFKDRVSWICISSYQELSKGFMLEFKDYVSWVCISRDQELSEDFIREFQDKVHWATISYYQKISEDFKIEFSHKIFPHNWFRWSKKEKMKIIKNSNLYEIDGDYIIAYKSTKTNGVSIFNSQYQYVVGNIYTSTCDCNVYHGSSFGLSVWTKEEALQYYPHGELYKVKIHIDDIGVLVQNGWKIRCFKIEIFERIQ